MKTAGFKLFISVVVSLIVFVLFLLWNNFLHSPLSASALQVERPKAIELNIGEIAGIDLYGNELNEDMTISLVASVNHNQVLVDTYPIEGIYNAAITHKNILYLGSNRDGLKVIDISHPDKPRLVGEYLPGWTIVDIYRKDERLFLSCGSSGVVMMQIEDGGRLHHVANIQIGSVAHKTLVINGRLAVAAGSKGVMFFDVSDSGDSLLVNSLVSHSPVKDLAFLNGALYVISAEAQIEIYALDEFCHADKVGVVPLPESPRDIALFDNRLYLATSSGLYMYELDDPLHLRLNGHIDSFGSADKIYPASDQLYVIDSFSRIAGVDSQNEKSMSHIALATDVRTLAEKDNYLYLAGSESGLLVFDRNQQSLKQDVRTLYTQGSAHDIYVEQQWMYIADKRGGVLLKDLNDPEKNPQQISSRWSETFFVDNDRLFVAQADSGVEVFDISVPGQPQMMTTWPDLKAMRLSVFKHFLVATRGFNGIEIHNIRDINKPVLCDRIDSIHALDIATDEDYIYVAGMSDGLQIYELDKEGSLLLKSVLTIPFPLSEFAYAVSVSVQDGIAYVANGRSGLMIVDVADPEHPEILNLCDVEGFAKGVVIVADRAFISSQNGGVTVINVENPREPQLEAYLPVQGVSRGIRVERGLIYVARKDLGVTAIPVPLRIQQMNLKSEHHLQAEFPAVQFRGVYDLQISNQFDFVTYDGVVSVQ